jgi:hypothetical protein
MEKGWQGIEFENPFGKSLMPGPLANTKKTTGNVTWREIQISLSMQSKMSGGHMIPLIPIKRYYRI